MPRKYTPEIKEAMQRIEAHLHARYFIFDHGEPSLLKIGIKQDLCDDDNGLTDQEISFFLGWWTNRREYRAINVSDNPRTDLQGNQTPSYNDWKTTQRNEGAEAA